VGFLFILTEVGQDFVVHIPVSYLDLTKTLRGFISLPGSGQDIAGFHFLIWIWQRHREVLVPYLEAGQVNEDCISLSRPGQENPGFRFKRMWAM
jgi:hypothetical protein